MIFSGVKTSATIAATAAIVAEFVGANQGLGYVLLESTSTMDIELTFAVLVVLTIIGIVINYVVEFTEWAMTPWQRAGNDKGDQLGSRKFGRLRERNEDEIAHEPARDYRRQLSSRPHHRDGGPGETPVTFQLNWAAGGPMPASRPPSQKVFTRRPAST